MPLKYYDSAPYFDDYDQTKNYQRILFRPGYSVQARELTQMQTALQAQIDRFGRHVFKEGSAAVGGLASLDVKFAYVKLESTFVYNGTTYIADNYIDNDPNNGIIGTTVTGVTSGITATVIDVTPRIGDDPLTIFVKYTASGNNNVQQLFSPGEDLLSNGDIVLRVRVKPYTDFPVGYGSRVSVNEGVFFVSGNFVYTQAATIILEKYIVDADARVVYTVSENIVTSKDDPTLTDNALGYPNEAAPGAHRYQIELTLAKQPIALADRNEANIIQLLVVKKGKVAATARTAYSELGDVLAQRTYEESGNYTVRPFQINIRELLNDNTNGGLYTVAQLRDNNPIALTNDTLATTYGNNRLAVGLEPSVAYVNGYRIQLEQTAYVEVEKARDEGYINGASILSSYGTYVLVTNVTSLPDINTLGKMTLKNGGTAVGTARARSFEYDSGTIGTSAAKYKLYLFDIVMSIGSFTDVDNISHSYGSVPQFTADLVSSTIYDTGANSLLFRLPVNTVQSLRSSGGDIDFFYRVKRKFEHVEVSGGLASITSNVPDETFDDSDDKHWIVILESTGEILPAVFSSYGLTNVSLSITGHNGDYVSIIAPTSRNAKEKIKTLSHTQIPISSPNTTQGGIDTLPVTDLFKVTAVHMSANFTADANLDDIDIKDRYFVDNGQRDNFYDVASLQLKPTAPAPTGKLVVVVDYFAHQPGDYSSVDSYTNQVDYGDIPSFQSSKGIVQLRDVIDFRPTKATSGDTFNVSSGFAMIRPTSIVTTDIQYYLPRIDKIYVDKNGKFGVVKGISSANPVAPEDPKDAMVLYVMRLGAYTFSAADTIPNMIDNKRYTMRDIGKIEKRVSKLEYYTSLSLLEKETAGTQIFDGANVRYKNGFVVDSFYGHNIGAITNPDYSVSMDKAQGRLRPMFFEDNTRLLWNEGSSSGLRKTGSLLTLNYYQTKFIEQPYSSYAEFVNPYNVFSWTGDLTLSPNTDEWKETQRAPDVVIDQTGIYDTLVQMLDASGAIGTVWNEWQTNWTGSAQNVDTQTTVYSGDPLITVTDTATTITTTTTSNLSRNGVRTSIVPDTITTNMGDKVVEVNFVPFIRSRKIYFKASRMKPNTKVYAFFDGIPMGDYVTSDTFVSYADTTNAENYLNATGHPDGSSNLVTDANGNLQGSFVIPNTDVLKFKTGSRVFRLTNSVTNDVKRTETSAEAVYFAQGVMNTIENQVVSTRVPQISRSAVNDQRVTVDKQLNTSVAQTYKWNIPVYTQPVPTQIAPGYPGFPEGSGLPPPDPTLPPEYDAVEPSIGDGAGEVPDWPVIGVTGPRNAIPNSTNPDDWPIPDYWRWDNGFQDLYVDPLAQSFIIDTQGGIFATSLDIYFAQKDDTAPVTVQIRTMVNGVPTQTVVPFSQTTKAAADITVSADASVATTFLFESPVYLMQGVEYCFVVMCNSDKHKIYVSELGEYDLTTPSYRITKQPYNGVMFKSANASTWTPEQTKDIKFTLRRAAFAQTGTAVFNNGTVPVRSLGVDPIQTTNGSNIVRVYHKNHGHFAGLSSVTLANVTANSGTALNGIPIIQLNTTHTVVSAEIDSYTIQVTTNATSTGRGGSPDPLGSGVGAIPAVTATENKTINVVHPIVQQSIIPATDIAWAAKVTSGKSLAGSEAPHIVSNYINLKVNDNTEFAKPQTIVSAPNVLSLSNTQDGPHSFLLKGIMSTASENISPVIDLDRMSVVTIANRIDNPINTATDGYNVVHNFVPETESIGGSVLSKYITRKVELNEPATALNIFTLVNKPAGTGIKLWYKVLPSGSDTNFETLGWTLKEPDSAIPTSDNPNDFTEAQYSITEGPSVVDGNPTGNLNGVEFTAFAVKITFTSKNSSKIPTCRDFRAIAIT
jgi:hypothetical protein